MDDSISLATGILFFIAIALAAFIIHLIKGWDSNDSVLAAKEEIKAMDKMDDQGRWHS